MKDIMREIEAKCGNGWTQENLLNINHIAGVIRADAYKEIGEWLGTRGIPGQDGSYPHFVRVEMSEIKSLRAGKSPTEESEK